MWYARCSEKGLVGVLPVSVYYGAAVGHMRGSRIRYLVLAETGKWSWVFGNADGNKVLGGSNETR